ncbi:L-ascorbate metabolism protein UlaG (beta-lactamase superfamily) [Paenibacillus shirakamiensis]|uniref:L-ascorbate metabolism protein UlaG (Beta-lactamase superfamily) n=1 Tax=Paenibacillus shirakamiensis TaxID=1265935 RepID=A0ABS4JLL6_9BACL|nr:MBL fold metallo-hydrolase [Paenibacillus shirakamiensis]MBP2001985.1 L-ascorbate metabolism protein UlaG (beta-lactamase superfamily) [Paenibacillus shirakamiensis]
MSVFITLIVIVVILWVAVLIFLKIYPPLGGRPTPDQMRRIVSSPEYNNGKFHNTLPTTMNMGLKANLSILMDFVKGNPFGKPNGKLDVVSYDIAPAVQADSASTGARVTWFGHSALLVELDGKRILLDPMLGTSPSPFPFIGGKRYSSHLPIEAEDLPTIDVVLLSHDHYDHLDYGTIIKIKDKVARFIVPLGVSAHLIRWGVHPDRVEEHDWWEETEWAGLKFACTPARHFSGRSLNDRQHTLWASWVIQGEGTKLFFSGDSGYGPHFREIGERFGPFDLTLMECGQYDYRWPYIHMKPEETVQAQLDIQGKRMIPIHWGAFTLAMHDWTDPVERVIAEANKNQVVVCTPRIGEAVLSGSEEYPKSRWWVSE